MITIGALRFNANTIPGMLHQRAQDFPDDPCYLFPESGQSCTWSFLWHEVKAVAAGLRKLGIQNRDRVAILMEGRAEQVICIYAAIAAGGVAVPLSTYLTKEELKGCLLEAQPTVFIMGASKYHLTCSQLHDVVADHSGPEALSDAYWLPHHAFVQGVSIEAESVFRSYEALKSAAEPEPLPVFNTPVLTAHDPAFLLFSSGTTGRSKGIVRSAASFMAQSPSSESLKSNIFTSFLSRKGNAYVNRFGWLSLLPLYHLAGTGMMLMPLQVCNIRMVMLSRFNPLRGLEAIAKTKARFLIGTPHMIQAILALEEASSTSLESILGVFFASAALRPHVVERIVHSFKNLYFFLVSYGSTETGAVANGACFPNNRRHKTIALILRIMRSLNYLNGDIPLEAFFQNTASIGGKIARQVEVGIRSLQTGEWLPTGQEGEILVRSHRLMPYQDEIANRVHFAEGGWFKTGDLGYVDAHNCIMITDRLKRVISRGGEKIAPGEIESLMKLHPGIEEVIVMGIPDTLYGEVVGAAYTEKEGVTVSVAALRETLQASLSSFKVPQYFLRLSALPLNATGKIAVAEVRSELLQMTHREYA